MRHSRFVRQPYAGMQIETGRGQGVPSSVGFGAKERPGILANMENVRLLTPL